MTDAEFMAEMVCQHMEWERELNSTKWLQGIRKLMEVTSRVLSLLHLGEPVSAASKTTDHSSIFTFCMSLGIGCGIWRK